MPAVQFPRRATSTATTIQVNSAGLPAWVPSVGKYADITSTTAYLANIDPCPGANCVYTGTNGGYPQGFNAKWTAWCGGIYASALGSAGSMIFFGGGHAAYCGNDVVRFDIATRAWSLMNIPAPYGEGYGGWPTVGDAPANIVGPFGAYPDGSPYPFHTNMGLCYLPSDAGGGTYGSLVFITHDQTGVICDNACKLWKFDLAVALSNPTAVPCPAWSYHPSGSTNIQNFAFGNGGAQRNALAYDDLRKGVWILRYSGGGELSFYSFLTGIETAITKTGDASWNVTGLDEPALTYHSGKDCLISRDSFNNLCVANLSGLNISSPTSVPAKFVATTGTPPLAYVGTPVYTYCDLLDYCSYDGNCYLVDWYTRPEVRLYKLVAPANVITGTWTWSYEVLTGQAGSETYQVRTPNNIPQSFYGRFRYVPPYKSFMWSDDSRLKPQIGRPSNFV